MTVEPFRGLRKGPMTTESFDHGPRCVPQEDYARLMAAQTRALAANKALADRLVAARRRSLDQHEALVAILSRLERGDNANLMEDITRLAEDGISPR